MYIKPININELKTLKLSSPFLSENWLSVYDNQLDLLGIFNKNNELIGVFTAYKFKRFRLFTQYATPQFMPTCELTFNDETSNPSKKASFHKSIGELIANYLNEKRQIITLEFPAYFNSFQPFSEKKFKVSTRHTYLLDLTKSEDALLENMSSERRKNIQKAIKDGLTIEVVENTNNIALELIKSTYMRQNAHVNIDLLKNLLANLSKEQSFMLIAKDKNGKVVAANFCVYGKEKTTYKFGGYSNDNKHPGAGALLMWEAIKKSKKMEVTTFDFDGSLIPSVDSFFRGFGGKLVQYQTISKAPFMLEVLLKTRQRNLF